MRNKFQLNLVKNLALLVFLVKLIIIFNIEPIGNYISQSGEVILLQGIFPGADAEAYMKGFIGFREEGFFSSSDVLSYWPAGYPLVIFILSISGISSALVLLSILQSFLFSLSVVFLNKQISMTKFNSYNKIICIFILLNPTLTLSSLVLGYESFVASLLIICISYVIKFQNNKSIMPANKSIIFGLFTSIIMFLQPRFIIAGAIFLFSTLIKELRLKVILQGIILFLFCAFSLTSLLIFRNYVAQDIFAISTNLGTTLNKGAGDLASGSYLDKSAGVPCITSGNQSSQDKLLIKCVGEWYIHNTEKIPKLILNKSLFFWSPWTGPLANGTTQRNPLLKIFDLDFVGDLDLNRVVFSKIGEILSLTFALVSFLLIFIGYLFLSKIGEVEKHISQVIMLLILSSWFISTMTIGDHRFRIPIISYCLILQSVAFSSLLSKLVRLRKQK
jgi:hypothetical protein